MADSYRLTVLKRFTTLLEGIEPTPVAGITLPAIMTGLVFRGRARFGDNDPPTLLSLLEGPRPIPSRYDEDMQTRLDQWPLLLQGWAPEDKIHPTDAIYSFVDDIERRLDRIVRTSGSTGSPVYPNDYLLGPALDGNGYLISSFQCGQPIVRPPTENISSKSFFYVPLQVGLARIVR